MPDSLRVFHSVQQAAGVFGPSALTIGNFDGVHLGHRILLERITDLARQLQVKPAVLTFHPHPSRVIAADRAPKLLTTLEQRCGLFAAAGISEVLIHPFDQAFSEISPTAFVGNILLGALRAAAVVVGENFRFGHRHQGDTRLLTELGREHHFQVEALPSVRLRGRVVSSTEIRAALQSGNVVLAAKMLGRPYALEGEVVKGHGVGSRQTVPTLNLRPSSEQLPRNGVYVTFTTDLDGSRTWQSITNVGFRPTFEGDSLGVETFLLEPLDGAPPRLLRVEFLHYVRDERKFDSPELLKQQIFRDVGRARTYFRRCPPFRPVLPPHSIEISKTEILKP